MQVQVVKKKKSAVKLAAVYYIIALALMPVLVQAQQAGQQAGVTETKFWQEMAKGVVDFLKTMLAIAFWGSTGLLMLYGIIGWLGPTKFTRLGALYDFVDTIKGWLLAVFVISAGIVGLIAGYSAIVGAFGGQAGLNAVQVLTDLLIKPIQELVGITQG